LPAVVWLLREPRPVLFAIVTVVALVASDATQPQFGHQGPPEIRGDVDPYTGVPCPEVVLAYEIVIPVILASRLADSR
jgi:hypothetical protein